MRFHELQHAQLGVTLDDTLNGSKVDVDHLILYCWWYSTQNVGFELPTEQVLLTLTLLTHRIKVVMQYEAEFTSLVRGLRDSLRHPLIPFHIIDFTDLVKRMRLIENDLMTLF
ncbi:hypothetical protein IEQ34_002343 [Dendrobium chrysotoxum]|uniref:Uncharacterized protein n=1 Tax=Dendrobium chrysotoxum TaxID=161865 RepID=A0AAV7HJ73_DENCH|nr:hypothetical protein IEQ34_002343 [Dendrobium chrysotoxum]